MSEFVKPSYEYLDHEHANAPEDLLIRAGPMDDFEKLDDDTIPTRAAHLETEKNIFEKGFETEFVGKTNSDFDADSLSSSPIHSTSAYAADVAAANLHNQAGGDLVPHPPNSQALLDFDDDHQKEIEEHQDDYLSSNLDLKYPQSLSTDRPLVTQPGADNTSVVFGSHDFQASSNTLPETTEVNLTPDPDDKLGLGSHEPFVNVTGNLIEVDNLESRNSHAQQPSPIYPGKLFNAQGYSINPAELDDEEDEEIVEEELEDSMSEFHRGPTHFKLESGPDVLHPSAPDLISNPYQQSHHVEEEEFSELNRDDSPPPCYELPEENTAFSSYISDKNTNSHQKSESEEEEEKKPSFVSHIKEETMNQSEKFKEVGKEIHPEHHIPKIEELIEELTPPFAACPSAAPPSKIELAKREELSGKCCAFHPRAWFKPEKLDPRVAELIYWRNVKKSGIGFGIGLVVLFSLSYFSFISVLAYLLLAVMTGTLSYRIYKNVLQAVQKSSDGHPFKQYLDLDLTLPREKVTEGAETFIKHLENAANRLRKLFLVEDLIDSLKFAVLLWCFTYIGAWFNGLTLVTLGFITIFTLPKVYETYKVQIDHYMHIVFSQIGDVVNKVKAKIPIGKKPKQQ